jgi:hypothetical protein
LHTVQAAATTAARVGAKGAADAAATPPLPSGAAATAAAAAAAAGALARRARSRSAAATSADNGTNSNHSTGSWLARVDPEVSAAVAAVGVPCLAPGPGEVRESTSRRNAVVEVECLSVYRQGQATGHSAKLFRKVRGLCVWGEGGGGRWSALQL